MTITFASIIGIPLLYVSDVIIRKIGSVIVIVLAFCLLHSILWLFIHLESPLLLHEFLLYN